MKLNATKFKEHRQIITINWAAHTHILLIMIIIENDKGKEEKKKKKEAPRNKINEWKVYV